MPEQEQKTHFGFESVTSSEKTQRVADVFHSVAGRYDLMNDLMSFGLHRAWKRAAVARCAVRPHQRLLDLAAGTGDMAKLLSAECDDTNHLTVSDINASMLTLGRDRLLNSGHCRQITYAQANAEALPFASNSFDLITIAFGLRNVTDKEKALASIERCLRPGGKLVILEFSTPRYAPLKHIYDRYSFSLLPKLGRLITGDAASYQYLVESIRMHPSQEQLLTLMQQAGLIHCQFQNLCGGVVALHSGHKC